MAPSRPASSGTTSGRADRARPAVGVLALQGAFQAHQQTLEQLGAATRQVRTPADLAEVDALVLPGGESTTMSRLLDTAKLFEPLASRLDEGMPVFGTCAGMILLAREVLDGRPDQRGFGVIDIAVRRNGYGRQVDSFETRLAAPALGGELAAVFIRAPRFRALGAGVEVLARLGHEAVLVRQERVLAATFHPEIAGDDRLHAYFAHSLTGG